MNLREGLGFQFLSPQEQQAYKIMLKTFSSMAVSVDYSQINRSVDLMKVLHTVLGDNPSVIYFNKTKIEVEESLINKRIVLTGVHSIPQSEKMNFSLDETVNKVALYVKQVSTDEYSLFINLY